MYCTNCENRIEEDAYVCVNCGMILKSRSIDKKNNNNILGVVSTILGCMALILSFMLFFYYQGRSGIEPGRLNTTFSYRVNAHFFGLRQPITFATTQHYTLKPDESALPWAAAETAGRV